MVRKAKSKKQIWILDDPLLFICLPFLTVVRFCEKCGKWRATKNDTESFKTRCPNCEEQALGYAKRVLSSRYGFVSNAEADEITKDKKTEVRESVDLKLEDGVYTDFSHRNNGVVLGFAVVKDGAVTRLSCPRPKDGGRNSELAAVKIVLGLVPNDSIFCDHIETVRMVNVRYIYRGRNPAHTAAFRRIGFVESAELLKGEIENLLEYKVL